MKKISRKVLSLMLVLSLILSIQVWPAMAAETKTITLLASSDLHNRLFSYDYAIDSSDADTGLLKIATLVAEERASNPNVLLIDNGDTIQDNSGELFNDEDPHPMIQAMNDIGYDVWTLGNHEFNFGLDFLNKNIAGFNGAVLSGNIKTIDTDEYFVEPYTIKEIDGVRVAVIGMIPPHVPVWEASTPDHFANLSFEDVMTATGEVLEMIEGQYDVLVGSYHLGTDGEYDFAGTEAIAEAYPEFDVIISGHAHAKVNEEVNGVKIIEPGSYGWSLAKAEIVVSGTDGAYSVDSVTTTQLETAEVTPDATLSETYAYVHEESIAEANRIVGTITADFIERPDFLTGEAAITTMPTSQLIDTPVMDIINTVQTFYTGADISSAALFNFGSNLVAGDFKKKDVAFIYKYDNTLIGVNITGENLLKYMEWSMTYYNTAQPGDITLSFNPNIRGYNYDMFAGIDYKVDVSKEAGSRIVDALIDGAPVDPTAVYKLAVNNYRFGTIMNLGFVTMEDKYYDSYEEMQDAGRIRDLIIKYTVEELDGQMTPSVDNNWSIIGFDLDNPYVDDVAALIADGSLTIPTSEDGRTMNVAAITLDQLMEDELIDLATYTIVSGDVLWKIAQSYGLTYQELADMNDLMNPNLIYAGDTLLVPAN